MCVCVCVCVHVCMSTLRKCVELYHMISLAVLLQYLHYYYLRIMLYLLYCCITYITTTYTLCFTCFTAALLTLLLPTYLAHVVDRSKCVEFGEELIDPCKQCLRHMTHILAT